MYIISIVCAYSFFFLLLAKINCFRKWYNVLYRFINNDFRFFNIYTNRKKEVIGMAVAVAAAAATVVVEHHQHHHQRLK